MAILLNSEGVIGEVPDEQAQAALEQGYAPAPPEQAAAFLDARQRREAFGTTGQAVLAGGEAAARALTLGGSTFLERAIGVSPESIQAREEVNPLASGLGTVAGIAAPLVLSGGSSALAQGGRGALAGAAELSAPSLVSRAGRAVVGALEGTGAELGARTPGLLPQATSFGGQLARRAVAEGLGSAVEGAAYGAGEVVHEAALGNPDLTAQSALGTVGMSAVMGGVAGAALGVVGPSITAAARKTRETVEGAFRRGEEGLKGIYSRAESATGVSGDVATMMIENKFAVEELAAAAPKVAEDLSNATPEMAQFILRNKDRFLEMERAFPGTTGQLARADTQTAEYLLSNWPKIFTDQNQRNVVAKDLFEGAANVIRSTDDLLKQANKEILPAERASLLKGLDAASDVDRVEATAWDLAGRVKAAVQKMQEEPDLYTPGYMRELELLRQGLVRDLLKGESDATIKAAAARGASEGPGVVRSARAGEGRVITPQNPAGEAVRYDVVEADELVPSHRPLSFAPNKDYPAGVQERAYHTAESEQKKVMKIGDRLDPALVMSDTPTAVDGPPIVTSGDRRIVLGGNGRTMGIQRAFASPAARENYKRELLDRAPAFGITPDRIGGMKAPVLVRVAEGVPSTAPQADLIAAVRRFNEGLTQELSPRARAVAEAKVMTPQTIESIGGLFSQAGDKSIREIMRERPKDVIAILQRDGLINDTNRAAMVAGEQLTDVAKDRIEGMFLGRVIGTGDRLESTAPGVLNKVEKITPHVLRVEGINPALGELPTVQAAVDLLNRAARGGSTVEQLLGQGTLRGLADRSAPDAATVALARLLESDNPTQLGARFAKWARDAAVDPRQGMMFGKPPTPVSARKALFEGLGLNDAALAARIEPVAAVVADAAPGVAVASVPAAKRAVSPRDIFERLRTFKQQMGELSDFGKDRLGMTRADRNATKEIARLWGASKGALTDETIFGPAAVRQAVIDDIQHEWISLMGKKGAFYRQFMTQGERGAELKTTKVSTWLNQMADAKVGSVGDLRGREAAATWGRMMDAAKRITNEIEQSSKNTSQKLDVEDLRTLFEKADAATGTARERAAVTLAKAGLEGRTLLSSHPIISPTASIAQQAAGKIPMVGGTLRTMINIGKGAVSVPRTVAVLASLERTGAKVGKKIDTLASTLVRAGVKAGNIAREEVLAGLASEFAHDLPRAKIDFTRQADQIRTLAGDPAAMMQSLDELTDDLHEHAPDTAQAIGLAHVRGVMFLASKLPQPPPARPLGPKWEPSRAEIAQFQRYAVAVDEPLSILKQASAGTLTPEGVEAVKTVYPDLYESMQTKVIEALTRHPDVPYRSRQMLGMLLGMDLDGSRAGMAANQAAMRAEPSAPSQQAPSVASKATPARADSLNVAQRTETSWQRTAAR